MNNKLMIKEEKGISLLITFLVLGIVLSVILGITVILYSEIKSIRNIGYSVVSFYMADSGLEKTLYYDRKQPSEDGFRGICNICESCDDNKDSCEECELGPGCDAKECTDCTITYKTMLDDPDNSKEYSVIAVVSPDGDTFQSFGKYKNVSRAIEIASEPSEPDVSTGPVVADYPCTYVAPRAVPQGIELHIVVNISDINGLEDAIAKAIIQSPDNVEYEQVPLEPTSGYTCSTCPTCSAYETWIVEEVGAYYVDISVCDGAGECRYEDNIQGIP